MDKKTEKELENLLDLNQKSYRELVSWMSNYKRVETQAKKKFKMVILTSSCFLFGLSSMLLENIPYCVVGVCAGLVCVIITKKIKLDK